MWFFPKRGGLRHARGKALDALVARLGVYRKHYFWCFYERDSTLRMRALNAYMSRP